MFTNISLLRLFEVCLVKYFQKIVQKYISIQEFNHKLIFVQIFFFLSTSIKQINN